jgi:hypothetical protein
MITANEIKTRGVKAIEEKLKDRDLAPITVRGKTKYVVMRVETYDDYREMEIDQAYREVMEDIEKGDYTTSVADHIEELRKEIGDVDH